MGSDADERSHLSPVARDEPELLDALERQRRERARHGRDVHLRLQREQRDERAERPGVLEPAELEALVRAYSELRMALVLGEDDGFADPVAAFDLDPVLHQMCDDVIDGIFVEEPGI